jgi:hypothetical protein
MASTTTPMDSATDSKAKTPGKSGVSFPYFDLAFSIEVAKTIHEKAGGVCDVEQMAALLGYTGVKNGAFRMRVSAAKMFGLVEETDGRKLRPSQRGLAIIAPVSEADADQAKLDAFMSVELFRKVFEQFRGTTLPEQAGLRNLLATQYQVVQDRVAPTVRVMLESAEHAGLFRIPGNRTRMVMPIKGSAEPIRQPPTKPIDQVGHNEDRGRQSGGGSHDRGQSGVDGIDPAILGLLQKLPKGGTPIGSKRKKALIDAFTATVGFIYPDAEEEKP